jgi:hypothetical protein
MDLLASEVRALRARVGGLQKELDKKTTALKRERKLKKQKRREVFIKALDIYWDEKMYLDHPPNDRMLQLAQSVGIDPLEILRSYNKLINEDKGE